MCRFHVAAGEKLHADKIYGAIVQSVAKLVGINLRKFGSFSYWFDKPWFHN
jgi:CRISPR/Cas system CSM-associated protein Csm4 (group 5 of RAMP superfamily)